jgi:hypothetical protein
MSRAPKAKRVPVSTQETEPVAGGEPKSRAAAATVSEAKEPKRRRRATAGFEQSIGYRFKDPALLEQALTHISAITGSRNRGGSYQRLEFLGDHVLGLVISDMLFRAFPKADEGELSRRLADLVRREACADVARASVDRLLEWAPRNRRVVVAFMGGEPLLNRKLLHETVRYADAAAKRSGHAIAFSMTTNATLMRDEDAKLFSEFPFSITVSIDGTPQVQDRQRPMLGGGPSSARLLRGLDRLLAHRPQGRTSPPPARRCSRGPRRSSRRCRGRGRDRLAASPTGRRSGAGCRSRACCGGSRRRHSRRPGRARRASRARA